ncbi:MAG: hypothetical protein KIT16_23185 [Rhodospirillaceae bacterium]|nr:hypothetical protein [Rhodospirillaceae bacterium]
MTARIRSAAPARLPGVLYWLAFGVFAVATDSFLIAGILPDIAAEFRVHTGTAGYLLMGFALSYAVRRRCWRRSPAAWTAAPCCC